MDAVRRTNLRIALILVCLAMPGLALADAQLVRQGVAAHRAGDLREAARLFELAVANDDRVLGERHPESIRARHSLATIYREQGRLGEALALAEVVVTMTTSLHGERHADTLAALHLLAAVNLDAGRTEQALGLNERVLHLRSVVLGERHPDTLNSMNSVAASLSGLGRRMEQLALYEKVFRLRSELLGERHGDTLSSMYNLAMTYRDLGRFSEGLALAERHLKLRSEVAGERDPLLLKALAGLAPFYLDLGRSADALTVSERAARLGSVTLGDRHLDTLRYLALLALSYGQAGRIDEQIGLEEKVVRLRVEAFGERHPDTLNAMNNLAITYGELGRRSKQLELIEKVVRLRTQASGERHPLTLAAVGNLAAAYDGLGRPEQAAVLLERLLELSVETLGRGHKETLATLSNLARAYVALGRHADASRLSDRFVQGAEWRRRQPGLSPENRRALFEGLARSYRQFSLIHGRLGELAQGFRLTEMGKARTLLETLTTQRAGRAGILPIAEEARLDDLNRQASALGQRIPQTRDADRRLALETTYNDLVRQYEALQSQLKASYPKYAQMSDVQLLGAADLMGLVPDDAMVVSFVVHGTDVAAYLVDSSGLRAFQDLGSIAHLADAVEILRVAHAAGGRLVEALAQDERRAWRMRNGGYRLLPASQPGPGDATELSNTNEVAQFLASRLLTPLTGAIRTKAQWIISPDGALARLPFETLPVGDSGQPAVSSARIHYTQSLSVYALARSLQRGNAAASDRLGLFAMGNAQYQPASLDDRRRRILRAASPASVQMLSELDGLWPQLPGTEREVRAVAALFPDSSSVHLGAQATEQQLQSLNARGELKRFRYLLFSAHGYVSPEQPALSSIVLGLQSKTAEADGYVTASEWPSYDLRSDLVVLSACDTGLGRIVSGEGVMGLPYALQVAGNVNTLLTLWPVDDRATAEFVKRFFELVKDEASASQALARTKREFLSHPRYAQPRFWAPFVLIGAG